MTVAPVEDVVATFQRWLYLPKPDALLATLGAVAANRLPGDPVWLLLVGAPGGGKSEMLNSLLGIKDTRACGTLTERALLSGTAKKEQAADAKGGLLKELGAYGVIVLKDFGSILSIHKDERMRVMAALREIYDGAWTRDVGVDGGRKLHWTGKVGLVGGVTPMIDRHHGVIGSMGERFAFYRLPDVDPTAIARKALAHVGRERTMRAELAEAVRWLFEQPMTEIAERGGEETERLVGLVNLIVHCRSAVERDTSRDREIELVPSPELPTRLIAMLDRLLAGMLMLGATHTTAWRITTEIAFSSMPKLRRDVLQVLFAAGDERTTTEIAEAVRHPANTTRRALEDLTAHLVVDRHAYGKGHADGWTLATWAQQELLRAMAPTPARSNGTVNSAVNMTVPENRQRSAEPAQRSQISPLSNNKSKRIDEFRGHPSEEGGVVGGESTNGAVELALNGKPFEGEEPPPWTP